MELSSEEKKRLRAGHPLFTRLSGDVVWALFEEAGFDPENCETMMDEVLQSMQQTLGVMAELEADSQDGAHAAYVIRAQEDCPHRAALEGLVISTQSPGWKNLLPPYAVGCSMSCAMAENTAPGELSGDPLPARPNCGLMCPLLEEE